MRNRGGKTPPNPRAVVGRGARVVPVSAAAELHAKFSGGDCLLGLYVATALIMHVMFYSAAFAGAIDVWSERNRLHLSETPDRVILYIHVSLIHAHIFPDPCEPTIHFS